MLNRQFERSKTMQILATSILCFASVCAHAQKPEWTFAINLAPLPPSVPAATPPAQVVAVQPAPMYVNQMPIEQTPHDREYRDSRNNGWAHDREAYYTEREQAFIAREMAFIEREKQRQQITDNNQRAMQLIEARQDAQLQQIVDGVNINRITKEDFLMLMAQQKDIRGQKRNYLTDGLLSKDEYTQLNTQLDAADQAIANPAANRRPPPRPSRPNRRYER